LAEKSLIYLGRRTLNISWQKNPEYILAETLNLQKNPEYIVAKEP
jgi:hypothetical protein